MVVYSRGGFYERYLLAAPKLNKPAPAEATDATGHDIRNQVSYLGLIVSNHNFS